MSSQRAPKAIIVLGFALTLIAFRCEAEPASDASIREFLTASGQEAQLLENAKFALPLLKQMAQNMPDDLFRELTRTDRILDSVVPIYRKYYSEEEIRDLIAFYGTPIGNKYAKLAGKIQREGMEESFRQGQMAVTNYKVQKGQLSPRSATTNPVLEERLQNAQVTKKTLSNGAVITEIKFAGSLQPNFDLGCIPISEVSSQFNPPALIYAAKKCIQQGEYAKARALLTTGSGFAYYDLKRLADRSTQGARTVLTMNALADLTNEQRERAQKAMQEIEANPEQVKAYCAELTRIGPPTYEPMWAIRHGIGAYQEPRDGHYLTNVNTKALWEEVLKNRCTPKS